MVSVHATSSAARQAPISRICHEISGFSCWDLLDWLPIAEEYTPGERLNFAWRGGAGDLQLLAWGALTTVEANGPQRFELCRDDCSAITEQEPSSLPLWVGGLAFADEGPHWDSWPGACFYLPRFLALQSAGKLQLILNVAANADLLAARGRLEVAVEEAHRWVMERRAQPPVATVSILPPAPKASALRAWKRRVERARLAMQSPHSDLPPSLEKVVLARSIDYHAPEGQSFSVGATLQALARRHPSSTIFCIRPPGASPEQAFVGATPERLLKREGCKVTTSALAGTAPRGSEAAHRLVQRSKELHEHALVAAALRQKLRQLGANPIAPARPHLRELADLVHLETPIEATLPEPLHALTLAAHLHPTPAVGGTPAAPALAWINRHEGLDRGYYAGPIGYFDGQGNGQFAVALRSARIAGAEATAFVGAGITHGSDPEAEWRETECKLQTIERALSLAPCEPR